MTTKIDLKQLQSIYNMLVNLIWSVLSLVPLCIFCCLWVNYNLLLLFFGFSLLPAFLSNSVINKLQISGKAATYKNMGIAIVQHLSQNGVLVNYLIRKKYPGYKAIRLESKSIERLLKQTYVFEKFHLICFIFFSLIVCYALSKNLFEWARVIAFINLFYNIYPILLQQYIRVKLSLYSKKGTTNISSANISFTRYRLKCLS